MACFLVLTAEAVVTTVTQKVLERKESTALETKVSADNTEIAEVKIPFTKKLKWLNNMLWGGSALLAFEHVWHGEVVPWFPFLTAASNAEDAAEMLHEMSTVGVAMAVTVTTVWLGMVGITSLIAKRADKKDTAEVNG